MSAFPQALSRSQIIFGLPFPPLCPRVPLTVYSFRSRGISPLDLFISTIHEPVETAFLFKVLPPLFLLVYVPRYRPTPCSQGLRRLFPRRHTPPGDWTNPAFFPSHHFLLLPLLSINLPQPIAPFSKNRLPKWRVSPIDREFCGLCSFVCRTSSDPPP